MPIENYRTVQSCTDSERGIFMLQTARRGRRREGGTTEKVRGGGEEGKGEGGRDGGRGKKGKGEQRRGEGEKRRGKREDG